MVPHPHPDPSVKSYGTEPRIRIRIRIKMSRIPNTRKHSTGTNLDPVVPVLWPDPVLLAGEAHHHAVLPEVTVRTPQHTERGVKQRQRDGLTRLSTSY
jgi:hypothetical protein